MSVRRHFCYSVNLVSDDDQYDTLFNYQINKCGFCRKMKQAIVKQKWSESEQYPLINKLTCVNENCIFYLIFYSDN